MGEGFVVMQSNDVDIYYYQDEPGTPVHTLNYTRTFFIISFVHSFTQVCACVLGQNKYEPKEREACIEPEFSSSDSLSLI